MGDLTRIDHRWRTFNSSAMRILKRFVWATGLHAKLIFTQPSEPTYLWRWNGTHTFEWKSRHACREASHITTTAPEATEAPSPGGSDPIAEPPQVPDEVVEHVRPNPVLVLATVVGTILYVLMLFRFPCPSLTR